MSRLTDGSMDLLGFIRLLVGDRRWRRYFVASSILFYFAYLFANGMMGFLPFSTSPTIYVLLDGPIGEVPWVIIYFYQFMVSINLLAGLSSLVISILFGLNIAGVIYLYNAPNCSSCRLNLAASSVSVIPAFFALFSCCGGGLVLALLILFGASDLVAGLLLPYSTLFILVSTILLTLSLYLVYRRAVG